MWRQIAVLCQFLVTLKVIKEPACYNKPNPNKPSCIDFILTSKLRSFKHSYVIETGLSDFHRMTVTVMKAILRNLSQE